VRVKRKHLRLAGLNYLPSSDDGWVRRCRSSSLSLVDRTVGTSELGSSEKVEPHALEMAESSVRRLLELRLLHHWMSQTSTVFTTFASNIEEQKYWWTVASTQKAFEHNALLNFIYAITALHWSKLEPDNKEVAEAHRKYLDLALSGHRDDVASLSKKNADAVCLTSALVRTCTFSGLSARDLEPYTPPSVWLKTTQASGQIWVSSWDWVKDDKTSISGALFKATPTLLDPALMFHTSNRKGLSHLLRSNLEDDATQLANPEIVSAYETTLSYIGGIKLAIAAGQPMQDILKRLASFPMWINRKFTPLVEESQPRALVILCHYFALLTMFKNIWWIGDTGEREIRAIGKILLPQWLPSMAWPMQVVEEPSILALGRMGDSLQSSEAAEAEIGSENSPRVGSANFTVPSGQAFGASEYSVKLYRNVI
jgi:hypothetical protein